MRLPGTRYESSGTEPSKASEEKGRFWMETTSEAHIVRKRPMDYSTPPTPPPSDFMTFLRTLRARAFKVDIVFLFCAIIIPTVVLITTFTYYKNSKAAMTMTSGFARQVTAALIRDTDNYMKPVQVIADISARLLKNPRVDISPHSDLEDYLIGIIRAQPQVDYVYYGTEDGEFIQAKQPDESGPIITRFIDRHTSPPIETSRYYDRDLVLLEEKKTEEVNYDPRKRPWYRDCVKIAAGCWTDPYIFSSTGAPGITASFPVMDDAGRFFGVVGADITLRGLCSFLHGARISEHSTTFIMDEKRNLLAFPDPDRMLRVSDGTIVPVPAADLKERWIRDAVREFEDSGATDFVFESEGTRFLAYFTPFPPSFGKKWTIVVLAPEDDFIGPVKETFRTTLLISVLILLVAVGFGLIFARNLSRPIEQLTEEVRRIKDFDLEGRVTVTSAINEIQAMAGAVDSMKTGLQAFSRYVPTALVRGLIESGQEAVPGGKERELTLFFSDIEGFTTISEKIPARELMVNLSEYLDVVSRTIGEQGGTLDKYIGDAVMAFWGAPLPDEHHAVNACRAALECRRALHELNSAWQEAGKIPFTTRMGIHTGFTIVGNMGSRERLNYTVLGDNVNLASRLEGVNKYYGTRVLISQATHRYVRNDFIVRPLDIIAVKGKLNSVMIYELLGDDKSEDAERLALLAGQCARMFELYLARRWDEALSILTPLKDKFPGDVPVSMYLKRCAQYRDKDPGPEWSGTVRLDSK